LPLTGKGIITPFQQQVLRDFSAFSDSKFFYLTGGTALSEFYYGHRKSYDFDLFTAEPNLILPFARALSRELKGKYNFSAVRNFESLSEFELSKGDKSIRVQLALDSPFRFEPPEETNYGVKVNGYRDLIVDKMLAYYGRAETRDAVDLYLILEREDFNMLSKSCGEKDPGFDLYWFAAALEKSADFPDNIERLPIEMLIDIDVKDMKQKFDKLAKEIIESLRKK
jgi:hypothetical protein